MQPSIVILSKAKNLIGTLVHRYIVKLIDYGKFRCVGSVYSD